MVHSILPILQRSTAGTRQLYSFISRPITPFVNSIFGLHLTSSRDTKVSILIYNCTTILVIFWHWIRGTSLTRDPALRKTKWKWTDLIGVRSFDKEFVSLSEELHSTRGFTCSICQQDLVWHTVLLHHRLLLYNSHMHRHRHWENLRISLHQKCFDGSLPFRPVKVDICLSFRLLNIWNTVLDLGIHFFHLVGKTWSNTQSSFKLCPSPFIFSLVSTSSHPVLVLLLTTSSNSMNFDILSTVVLILSLLIDNSWSSFSANTTILRLASSLSFLFTKRCPNWDSVDRTRTIQTKVDPYPWDGTKLSSWIPPLVGLNPASAFSAVIRTADAVTIWGNRFATSTSQSIVTLLSSEMLSSKQLLPYNSLLSGIFIPIIILITGCSTAVSYPTDLPKPRLPFPFVSRHVEVPLWECLLRYSFGDDTVQRNLFLLRQEHYYGTHQLRVAHQDGESVETTS